VSRTASTPPPALGVVRGRRMTNRQLAERLEVSEGWVGKVPSGCRIQVQREPTVARRARQQQQSMGCTTELAGAAQGRRGTGLTARQVSEVRSLGERLGRTTPRRGDDRLCFLVVDQRPVVDLRRKPTQDRAGVAEGCCVERLRHGLSVPAGPVCCPRGLARARHCSRSVDRNCARHPVPRVLTPTYQLVGAKFRLSSTWRDPQLATTSRPPTARRPRQPRRGGPAQRLP
jgi:hypothetical protein